MADAGGEGGQRLARQASPHPCALLNHLSQVPHFCQPLLAVLVLSLRAAAQGDGGERRLN
eukprot:1151981-Pelagomonas_calceolata.AAC.4